MPTTRPCLLPKWLALLLCILTLGHLGCSVEPSYVHLSNQQSQTHYTRYTIRGVKSTGKAPIVLYSTSYVGLPVLFTPGRPVTVWSYSATWVDLEIDGQRCRMVPRDVPFPATPAGVEQFLTKHFVRTLNEVRLQTLDISNRRYIDEGRAVRGMTKDQVLMALGHPSHVAPYAGGQRVLTDPLALSQIFEHNEWVYRVNEVVIVPTWRVYRFTSQGILDVILQ